MNNPFLFTLNSPLKQVLLRKINRAAFSIFTFSSPIALTDEVYFFAIQSSASTVALSYLPTGSATLILMRPNATELNSYSKAQAYGAFPNPVVTPVSSTSQPIIYAITQ